MKDENSRSQALPGNALCGRLRRPTRIVHKSIPTRSASEGGVRSCPRLHFGLVLRDSAP